MTDIAKISIITLNKNKEILFLFDNLGDGDGNYDLLNVYIEYDKDSSIEDVLIPSINNKLIELGYTIKIITNTFCIPIKNITNDECSLKFYCGGYIMSINNDIKKSNTVFLPYNGAVILCALNKITDAQLLEITEHMDYLLHPYIIKYFSKYSLI